MSNSSQLLKVLLKVSEKAANIARVCRQDKKLFALLVQEKSEEEKNPRFFQDFKTLADVLIQETIRHDIGLEFPELANAVKGEENNIFSNTLGETITVEVSSDIEKTVALLSKVLNNDQTAARLLSQEVHKEIKLTDVTVDSKTISSDIDLNISDLGIWIDPIDSTADYINGGESIDENTGLHLKGLHCVTVLIGAYFQSSGLPVLGVVNQPFYTLENEQWKGKCYWGYSNNGVCSGSLCKMEESVNRVILTSRTEESNIKSVLRENNFKVIEAAGAGYKLISVALGQAGAYVLSKGSTYKWDICGPHSILISQGGNLLDCKNYFCTKNINNSIIKYSQTETCNKGGLIAYRDKSILEELSKVLNLYKNECI